MRAATSAFADLSSPEQNSTRRPPFSLGSPARISARRWLKAFTTRAPGTSSANTSLDTRRARAGYELGKHLARHAALEIDRLEQRGLDRIGGVDNDAALPIPQPRKRRRRFAPVDRDQRDVGARSLFACTGPDRRPELSDQFFQGVRAG